MFKLISALGRLSGENGTKKCYDPILIHLVLQRVFLSRTIENKISTQRKQAGILHVGMSHYPLDVYMFGLFA